MSWVECGRAAFGVDNQPVLNRSYREFGPPLGFKIDPTPQLLPCFRVDSQ